MWRPWEIWGAKRGRFGTPQRHPFLGNTLPGRDACVRTAKPFGLIPSHVAHATDLAEHTVERISKNDAGIDGFRYPCSDPTPLWEEPFPKEAWHRGGVTQEGVKNSAPTNLSDLSKISTVKPFELISSRVDAVYVVVTTNQGASSNFGGFVCHEGSGVRNRGSKKDGFGGQKRRFLDIFLL